MATNKHVDLQVLAVRREAPDRERMPALRRHVLTRYVLPGVLVAGFVALTGWALRDAFLSRKPVTVVPVHVSRAAVQQAGTPLFQAAGWVEPRPTPVSVAALTSGVVKELLVVEDQYVEQGEPVARLVAEDAELALAEARAAYALREAEVARIEAVRQAAQTNFDIPAHLQVPVAEAEAELARIETEIATLPLQQARAEARLRLAKADLDTKQNAGDAISEIALIRAQSELEATTAEVAEYRSRLPVLRQQRDAVARKRDAAAKRLELKTDELQALGEASAQLQSAQASLDAARVAVDVAKLRLERMVVRAPVSGRVLKLLASPGTQLNVGNMQSTAGSNDGSTVVTMYQPDQLQVRVDVRFEDLPHVGREQPVLIQSPAVAEPLRGEVLFLTGYANIQKNTLEVKVSLADPPSVLKPEMLVDVTYLAPPVEAEEPAGDAPYRLLVPRELVETAGDVSSVWIADMAGRLAHRQIVELGPQQSADYVEVISGLTAGSRLIAGGRQSLEEGDRIEVTGEDPGVGSGGVSQKAAAASVPAESQIRGRYHGTH